MDKYILDQNNNPIKCDDILEWAEWFEKDPRRQVAKTKIGRCLVSTVFLGINHNFFGEGPPKLWETMVFAENLDDDEQERYTSQEYAIQGHNRIVATMRAKYGIADQD